MTMEKNKGKEIRKKTSLKLATNSLGLLSQPAVAGAGSLGELQLRIYRQGGWGAGVK